MPSWKKVIISGSSAALNSLTVSNGITGSLFGTSSFAVSSSRAVSSSNALTASFVTSSNVFGPFGSNSILSASFAVSSSRAVSSSNALTASFVPNTFIQNGNSFGTTATLGTNDNQSLQFETNGTTKMFISSSGNVGIGTISPVSGTLHVNGNVWANSYTGSLFGTASWATNATTVLTASNITPAITNAADNRVLTSNGGGTINGEANLTFNGSNLILTGSFIVSQSNNLLNTVQTTDGTKTSPAYSFISDTDTGMYRDATNTLGLTAGGESRIRLSDTNLFLVPGSTTLGTHLLMSDNLNYTTRLISTSSITVGAATTATNATNIAITNDTTTNATYYPIFSSATSGNTAARVDSSTLTYNPSTNTLTTTTFAGALSGNATTATTATNSTNATVTTSTTNSDFKIPFANTTGSTTGNYGLLQDSTAVFTYNPSTDTFTAPIVNSFNIRGGNGSQAEPAFSFSADTNNGMYLPSSDNIGFVTSGSIRLRITAAGAMGLGITPTNTSGRFEATNDIIAFSSSDKNWKKNIKNINSPLEKLSQINGVEFDWIEDEPIHGNKGHDIGVIAQEIEQILPEIVQTRESGMKAVQYDKIIPLLIESIKEQQKQIEELKQIINGITR